MLKATCLSNMSWYMLISLLLVSSAEVASRMLFSIICKNSASTCFATALMASGEFGSRFKAARPLTSVYVAAAEASSGAPPVIGSIEVVGGKVVI